MTHPHAFHRLWFTAGAVLGGLAVVLGAFGAHLLEPHLTEAALRRWRLASTYQATHSLALLAVGLAPLAAGWRRAAGFGLLVGTLIFAGSLYLLALTDIGWFGAITPIGGAALISGWFALAIGALRVAKPNPDNGA